MTLSPSQRNASLLLLVYGPYIRAKLDALHADILDRIALAELTGAANTTLTPPPQHGSRYPGYPGHRPPPPRFLPPPPPAARFFARWYPPTKAALRTLRLAYQILYMLGRTQYWGPEYHVLGVVFQRLSPTIAARLAARRQGDPISTSTSPTSRRSTRRRDATSVLATTATWVRTALIAGVFGFKLAEWWFATGEEQLPGVMRARTRPPAPPPPPARPHPHGVGLPSDRRSCPLCCGRRKSPAALTVSGYVFCHDCILSAVEREGCCPVTRIPAQKGHVRKLYLST